MKKEVILKIQLELCDINRNFEEIIESIYHAINERDAVNKFTILEEI